jgi:hypothetical protein
MPAKLPANNDLTLPKRAPESVGVSLGATCFEIEVEDGRLVLTPARTGSADAVRRKLAKLGLTDTDVADAVAWARTPA